VTGTELRAAHERAAIALRRGDPLTALTSTDRDDAPIALAIRGAALAQLDEPAAAVTCLTAASKAATRQGDRDTAARAELALAEIHVASRDFAEATARLDACGADLAGDHDNHALVAVLRARIEVFRGSPASAARHIEVAAPRDDFGRALVALSRAEVELAAGDPARCEAAIGEAVVHAERARHGFLLAEIAVGRERLRAPIARLVDAAVDREASVLDLAAARARRDAVVVDELRRAVVALGREVKLAARPQIFAIVARLVASHPGVVARDELVLALGVRKVNEAHRATLRVELGRLRALLPEGVAIVTEHDGWRFATGAPLVRVLPRPGELVTDVAALLSDGLAWRADDVARALGASPRSAQRHLAALRDEGVVRSVGAGRAVRWLRDDSGSFTILGQLSALWAAGARAGIAPGM
jgi:DNA-binding transcriptional ArsR family regulator